MIGLRDGNAVKQRELWENLGGVRREQQRSLSSPLPQVALSFFSSRESLSSVVQLSRSLLLLDIVVVVASSLAHTHASTHDLIDSRLQQSLASLALAAPPRSSLACARWSSIATTASLSLARSHTRQQPKSTVVHHRLPLVSPVIVHELLLVLLLVRGDGAVVTRLSAAP